MKYSIKLLSMFSIILAMCVSLSSCSDDDELGVVAGKIFSASSSSGGGDGDNEHREQNSETMTFKSNGTVIYNLYVSEVWWGPDGSGDRNWSTERKGTYTVKGNTIEVSGISSSSVGGWSWKISGKYTYVDSDGGKLVPAFSNGHTFHAE